jgi:hypothetical protein
MRKSLSHEQNRAVALAAAFAGIQDIDGSGSAGSTKDRAAAKLSKERSDRLRNKIRTVARMARMFKTLREENETIIRLKGVCPANKLAPGLLLKGKNALDEELVRFTK